MGKAQRRLAGLILACLAVISGDASLGSDRSHATSIRVASNGRGIGGTNDAVDPGMPVSSGVATAASDASSAVIPLQSAGAGDVDLGWLSDTLSNVRTMGDYIQFRDGLVKTFRMTAEIQRLMANRQTELMDRADKLYKSNPPNLIANGKPVNPFGLEKDPSGSQLAAFASPAPTTTELDGPTGPPNVVVAVKENPTIKDVEPEQTVDSKPSVVAASGPKLPVAPVSGPLVSPTFAAYPPTVVGGGAPVVARQTSPEELVKNLKAKSDQKQQLRDDFEDKFAQFETRPNPSTASSRSPASVSDDGGEVGHGGGGSPPADEPSVISAPSPKKETTLAENPSEEGRKRFGEKRTAAIEEAEAALSDPTTPPDLLQSKLDTLLAYAEDDAKRGDQGDGLIGRIGSMTPQPVTIINRIEYPNLPVSGVKEKVVFAGQLLGADKGELEAEDPNGARRKSGVIIGELLAAREAKAGPGGLFPKKKTAPAVATAPGGEPILAEVAKVSKSLIQSLREAIAARRGIVRAGQPSDSEPSSMRTIVASVGRNVALAKGKIANLYVSAGFGNSSDATPVAAGVGLVCLLGLASATVMTTRRKRPRSEIKG